MDINFETINNFSVVPNPTSLDFGPDGRLYVTAQTGQVIAYTLAFDDGQVVVQDFEVLTIGDTNLGLVQSISNHDDDGSLFTGYDADTPNSGENPFVNRQVTGIITAGTAENPVLYISSSDPRIATNGDVNLDTNSGVITRATLNDQGEWEVVDIVRGLPRSEENHSVNGLQFDEESNTLYVQVGGNTNNGAPSGFFSFTPEYSLSGTLLEIDLDAIEALEAQGTNIDPNGGRIAASGANNNSNSLTFVAREFVYDLPTLDDPNRANDGVLEDENGLDVNGPFGGNDGFNQAILAPDSPVRVFADGQRNPFDIVLRSSDGQLFSVDNGGNGGLGGNPNEFNGEPVNSPNGGGDTDDEPLLLLSEGSNAGHPVPVRANPDGPGIIFNDAGQVNQDPATFTAEQQAIVDELGLSTIDPGDTDALNAALTTAIVPDLSALVPASLGIEPGFLIDPSRFAAGPGQNLNDLTPQELADRLAESGDRVDRSAGAGGSFAPISGDDAPTNNINALAFFDNTTNGITEYFGSAFANALNGALITASSNGNITLLNVNADGTGLDPIIVNGETVDQDGIVVISPGGLGFQLDVTTGPVGSQFEGLVFSAGFGPDNISVLAPTDQVIPGDPDIDNDGLFETNDPFTRDASNGAQATIGAQDTLVLDFDNNQDGNLLGPDGFGSGLTGLAINGVDNPEVVLFGDPEDPADGGLIGNVRIGTAAGGGVVNIVNVEQGTSAGTDNDQPLLFQSGFRVTPGVETFTARWVVGNPGLDIPDDATGENNGFVSGTNQEIGGFLGTGDQSNILRVVTTHAGGSSGNSGAGFIVEFENDDIIQSSQFISAADLFDNVNEIDNIFETITIEILVDRANGTATPTITYINGGTTDTTTVVGDPVDISGSNLEAAINNDFLLAADQGPDEISGIALGLFSSNGDATPEQAFSAIFDEVTVDTTGVPLTVIHRVNFGGGEVAALDGGPAFTADTNGNPSPFRVLDNMASNENVDSFGVTAGPTVSSSVPQAIFDSGRFDVATAGSPGELTYIFPDLEDGTYLVTVFLGNGFPGASTVGARIFDINLEGSVPTEFEDIDPVALFGDGVGGQLSAFVEVTDGALDVEFLHQVENPNPFGIEIALLGEPAPPPLSVSLNPDTLTAPEGDADSVVNFTFELNQAASEDVIVDYEVTAGSATGGEDFDVPGEFLNNDTASFIGLQATIPAGQTSVSIPVTIIGDDIEEASETFTVNITGASSGGETVDVGTATAMATITDDDTVFSPGDILYRVNSGGPEVAATDGGPAFTEDQTTANAGGTATTGTPSPFLASGSNNSFGSGAAIDLTQVEGFAAPESLFQVERFDAPAAPTLVYSFPVPEGIMVDVTLFFNEGFTSIGDADMSGDSTGDRIFDVLIDGVLVLDDFDIFAEAGAFNTAIAEVISVTSDGSVDIEFINDVQNPSIRGIEIAVADMPSDDPDTTPPVVTADLEAPTADDGDFVASLTFSEPVTGLEASDVTLSGPSGLSRSDGIVVLEADGLSATITFASPIQGFENGDYSVAVADAAVTDAAGNTSAATTSPVEALALALDPNEIFDENVNGDLSDDNLNPTDLPALTEGSNIVSLSAADANADDGTGLEPDRDYFSFEVPEGFEVSILELADYLVSDTNNLAFIAIAEGDNVDFSIDDVVDGVAPTPNNLLGAALVGDANEGSDILALLGSNPLGAGSGFEGPLGPGTYTIWYNQNLDVSRASLDIQLSEAAIVPPSVEVGPVLLAINAGGPAIDGVDIEGELIDFAGNQNTADEGNAVGGPAVTQNGITGDFLNGNQFGSAASVFTSERFGGADGGQFSFEASGFTAGQLVQVQLIFAENFQTAPGNRLFDAFIEDVQAIDDLDPFAEAGAQGTPVLRTFGPVEVSEDGVLDVDLSASIDNANISGIIIREVTDERAVISVGSPAPVEEAGDVGETILTFPISFSETPLVPITVDIEINNDGVISTQTVDLGTTGASIDVAVANDDEFNGSDAVTVTVTGVTEGDAFARLPFAGAVGTSEVIEDEISPLDLDDDDVLNTDDPFFVDGQNGLESVLEVGGEITLGFNTDSEDPFSADVGFTGVQINPAFDPAGVSEADPLGVLTTEDGVTVANGAFSVASSPQDNFQGGTGANNTIRDAYQRGADVSGVNSFEVVAQASSEDYASVIAGGGFEQFGIQFGAGGVDEFVKISVSDNGGNGANPARVQISQNNSLDFSGGSATERNFNLPGDFDLATVDTYEFRLTVDRDAGANGEVSGQVVFLDDTGAALLTIDTGSFGILPGSAFAAALDNNNPLTGGEGTGGFAYGLFITQSGVGGSQQFTADFDFLTIRALDTATVSIADAASVIEADDLVDGTTAVEVPVTTSPALANQTIDLQFAIIDTPFSETVSVVLDETGAGTAIVNVSGFNDDLANGDDVFTLTLTNAIGDFFEIDAMANTAAATITEDDFTPVATDDSASVFETGSVIIDLLANDTDADNDQSELTVSMIDTSATTGGMVQDNGDGTVTVTADPGTEGTNIVFTYTVSDPGGNTAQGTATVSVTDNTLVAIAATASATETGDDGVTPTDFAITTSPAAANQTISVEIGVVDQFSETVLVTLDANGAGTATVGVPGFNDDLANGDDMTALTLISVSDIGFEVDLANNESVATITEDDFAPVAVADSVSTPNATQVIFNPASNDTDADDLTSDLVVTDVTNVNVAETEATVQLIDGQVVVTPLEGFEGDVTFDYTVSDPGGNTAIGTATVDVQSPEVAVRIQAEDLQVNSGFFVENQAQVEEGALLRLGFNGATGQAQLDLTANGITPGENRIEIDLFDENDGESSLTVSLLRGDQIIELGTEILDDLGGGNNAQPESSRTIAFNNIVIEEGDILLLDGVSDNQEPLRIDALEFIPAGDDPSDNQPPSFNGVIADVELTQDVPFELQINESFPGFSDPDEDVLVFTTDNPLFTVENGVLTAIPTNEDALAFADPMAGGPFSVTVTATDPSGASAQTTFTVTNIINVNDAPEIETAPPFTLETGVPIEAFDLNTLVSDPDGDDVTVTVDIPNLPQGLMFDAETGILSGTPEIPGSLQVTITADDGQGEPNSIVTSSLVFNITGVGDIGDPVRIQAEDLDLISGFFVENQAQVEEGALIRLGFNGAMGEAQLTLTETIGITPGENRIEIDLFDENDGESTLLVSIQRGNETIELGTVILDSTTGGNNAQLESSRTIAFDNVDIQEGDVLVLNGTSDNLEPVRIDALEIIPTGGTGGNFAPIVIPTFEPDDVIEIPAGQSLDLNQVFADPEEDTLTFDVTDANGDPVTFLSIVNDQLVIAPDAPQAPIDIILSAVDADGSNITVNRAITVVVEEPVQVPPALIAEIADQTAPEDAEFILDVSPNFAATLDELSAAGGDDITFTATQSDGSDLPDWLDFDPATATFSGTPLQSDIGDLEVTVTATDDDGSVTDTFTIAIENTNDAPEAIDPSPIEEQTTLVNQPFTFDLPAAETLFTDEDLLLADTTEVLTVAFDPATLPSGVTINPETGALEGTPDTIGTFTVGVIATDVVGEMATSTFDIVVEPEGPLTDGAALFTANITGGGITGSSTFAENALQITNQSANDVSITRVVIDLTDTIIPDTAFDTRSIEEGGPIGDPTNKPFDQGSGTVGFTPVGGNGQGGPFDFTIMLNGEVTDPQTGGMGDNQLILEFEPGVFAVGDILSFSIDIDPFTATVGPIGGAVAGFEITGGMVSVEFDDGSSATSSIVAVDDTVAATAVIQAGKEDLGVPTLTLGDGTTDARVVNQANLPISIDAGLDNALGLARVVILDTAFVSNGDSVSINPPGGVDAIQGNNAQTVANVIEVMLDENGQFNGTIPLTRSTTQEANANGNLGFNYFAVGVVDSNGNVTQLSDPLVVEFDPDANVPPIGEPLGDVLLRINAGGPEVAAIDGGPAFLADVPVANPSPFFTGTQDRGDVDTTPLTPDLPNVPNGIFETARSDDGIFSYNIPLADIGAENGIFTVNLYFAEAFDPNNVPGARIFDIDIEGLTAFDNFDVADAFNGSGGVVSVAVEVTDGELNLEFVNGIMDNAIVSGLEIIEGGSDPFNSGVTPPGDPADALEVLGIDDGDFDGTVQGVAVDSVNDGGTNGSVQLTILEGDNNVQSSNFGANSFQITNTGNKDVAAVFIDVRGATFGDSVFDIDGSAGDLTNAIFEIDSESSGGVGAFFVGANGVAGDPFDNLFFPGDDPLPNTSDTGSNTGLTGGHRGLLLRFDGSEGGFGAGESVGFSGDMDPNSVAGFPAGTINAGFDSGGIGGAELIGSSFTILFADGTTATGFLGSDGSLAGAIGEAVQGQAPASVSLSVDTGSGVFSSSGDNTGTYGGDLPVITVSGGVEGQVVRVTLQKGVQSVGTLAATGAGDADVAAVVDARIQATQPEFPVNNTFDVQTFDVTLGAGGTATVPDGAFDFVNTDSGISFAGQDVAPISFTAAVINSSTDDAPLGAVSNPVFLTNPTQTPVDDTGVGVDEPEGFFLGIGDGNDFRFRIQIEDPGGAGVEAILNGINDNFIFVPTGAPNDNNEGEQGDGVFVFTNGNAAANNQVEQLGLTTNTGIINDPNASGGDNLLTYRIFIPEDQVGQTFQLRLRVARDEENFGNAARADMPALLGTDADGNLIVLEEGGLANDQQNDVRFNVVSVADPSTDLRELIAGERDSEDGTFNGTGFARIFGGTQNGNFAFTSTSIADVSGNATFVFPESGFYDVVIAGRSLGFNIDAIDISAVGNLAPLNASSSQFIEGFDVPDDPPPPSDLDINIAAITGNSNDANTVVASGTTVDGNLQNGDVLNASEFDDSLVFDITTNSGPTDPGSFQIQLLQNGNVIQTFNESAAPFTFIANADNLGTGDFTLQVTSFDQNGLGGNNLGTTAVDFTIDGGPPPPPPPPPTGDLNLDISVFRAFGPVEQVPSTQPAIDDELLNGDVVNIGGVSGNLIFDVETLTPLAADPGSLLISLTVDGEVINTVTENNLPFTLAIPQGDIETGAATLSITVFDGPSLTGTNLGTNTVNFTLTESAGTAAASTFATASLEPPEVLSVNPGLFLTEESLADVPAALAALEAEEESQSTVSLELDPEDMATILALDEPANDAFEFVPVSSSSSSSEPVANFDEEFGAPGSQQTEVTDGDTSTPEMDLMFEENNDSFDFDVM